MNESKVFFVFWSQSLRLNSDYAYVNNRRSNVSKHTVDSCSFLTQEKVY